MRAFFAKGTASTKADDSVPFLVNNCGYYRDLQRDLTVSRPEGRDDYQIIFVSRGELIANGEEVRSGGAYIFTPGQKQEYVYRAENKCLYYWVHFCGIRKSENSGKLRSKRTFFVFLRQLRNRKNFSFARFGVREQYAAKRTAVGRVRFVAFIAYNRRSRKRFALSPRGSQAERLPRRRENKPACRRLRHERGAFHPLVQKLQRTYSARVRA